MKNIKTFHLIILAFLSISGCKKDFLDQKPSSNILAPKTLAELQSLLDAPDRVNLTGALGQLSNDEYSIISDQSYNALNSATQRNAYVWKQNLYEGEKADDWNTPFQAIFYANSVLDILKENEYTDIRQANKIKGWALFIRAYAYFDLSKNFCKVYNVNTSAQDLGLPLRRSARVDETEKRASLEDTFRFILSDLEESSHLLDPLIQPLNKNRPSKAAVWALRARVYLYMGNYQQSERSADSTLSYHDKIIDFNTVSLSSETPFSHNADEVIFQSNQIGTYSMTTAVGNRVDIEINPTLYQTFTQDDLRKSIYFRTNTIGKINIKRGYLSTGLYQFTGLACDEIYLIKAECLARRNNTTSSMEVLNKLLIKRFKKSVPYQPILANTSNEALNLILLERRKELIWRGLRWPDLKRLNRDGQNISLNRSINGQIYVLTPNSPRYVFPIPDEEINQSLIEQN